MKNRTVSGTVSEFFRSQPSFALTYGRVFLALHPRGKPRGIRAEENKKRVGHISNLPDQLFVSFCLHRKSFTLLPPQLAAKHHRNDVCLNCGQDVRQPF